jgi:hypothetical protein
MIYFYFDVHLHLIKSPTQKVSKLGGYGQAETLNVKVL